jgi:hypothetical protein
VHILWRGHISVDSGLVFLANTVLELLAGDGVEVLAVPLLPPLPPGIIHNGWFVAENVLSDHGLLPGSGDDRGGFLWSDAMVSIDLGIHGSQLGAGVSGWWAYGADLSEEAEG